MKILNLIRNYIFKKIAQRNYLNTLNITSMNKILVIKNGGIGDAICIYPLLREIKKNYPHIQLDVYAGTSNYFMYRPVPYVEKIHLKYKKREWYKTWYTIYKMKQENYDLLMDFTPIDFKRTLSSIVIKPKYAISITVNTKKYGFERSDLSFYHKVFPLVITKHIVDSYLQLLTYIDISTPDNQLKFFLPKKENKQLKKFINLFQNTRLVGLNTDSSSPTRALNSQQIISLSQQLMNEDITIILFCMPHKRESFTELILKEKLTNIMLTYPTNSIFDAAELIGKMDIVITPDTSFIHIASGLNVPTVGLYWNIPTKTIEWGPKSDMFEVVTPTSNTDFSLRNINLSTVAEATVKLLSKI